MQCFKSAAFVVSLIIISINSFAQPLAIGQWKEHLPFENGISVTEGGGKVYCATAGGFFSVDEQDYSIERLSKVTGLSDIAISRVAYNHYNNTLVIGYKNGNIDFIKDNAIHNLSDIKREPDLGNKNINNIYFINQYAYLACGFGIVVIDTEKKEVKDTYKIGPNGAFINVYEVTTDGANIYAATEGGVYKASLTDPNLIYFGSWTKMTGIPVGTYNTIVYFGGKVIVNYSKNLTNGAYLEDTVFTYDPTSAQWNKFLDGTSIVKDDPKQIRIYKNKMLVCCEWYTIVYDNTLTRVRFIDNYGLPYDRRPQDAVVDESGAVWIADRNVTLIKAITDVSGQRYMPNGPRSANSYAMQISNGELWCAPGGVGDAFHNLYNRDGVSTYINGEWKTIYGSQSIANMDSLFDILDITIDPKNNKHVYATSFTAGLLEFNNGALTHFYNEANSTLSSRPEYRWLGIAGSAMDESGNLWVSNSNVSNCLSVRKSDGSWNTFDFTSFGMNSSSTVSDVIITSSQQKWIILPGGGILVYNGDNFAAPTASNTKKIGMAAGSGALPSAAVMCVTEDLEGEIWVGTDKGISVFHAPDAIFSSDNWDSQQIKIEQDGHVQFLLETETVKAIAIDGANRKWIGTQNSGVFLISEDGREQIEHFTETNSPLLSNEINCISIDGNNGEVFIGTSKGIVSYRATATDGLDEYTDVYAFPNPVRENYDGPIAIRGLIKDASVKITDINGGLVYSTKALGGQAIWDGKNFEGKKASTGVYLVFCSNEDGSKTFITKILFVN